MEVSQSLTGNDKRYNSLDNIYMILMDIKKDIGEMNGRIEQIDKRLTELEERIEKLEKAVYKSGNKVHIKYFIITIGVVLSFIATLFGLGWRPNVP